MRCYHNHHHHSQQAQTCIGNHLNFDKLDFHSAKSGKEFYLSLSLSSSSSLSSFSLPEHLPSTFHSFSVSFHPSISTSKQHQLLTAQLDTDFSRTIKHNKTTANANLLAHDTNTITYLCSPLKPFKGNTTDSLRRVSKIRLVYYLLVCLSGLL